MTFFDALLLGILQGLTEFLPVSSSGHLVLFEYWLGLPTESANFQAFDVMLHAGTALAIFCMYYHTWMDLAKGVLKQDTAANYTLILLIIATIPGAIAGLMWQDTIHQNFRTPLTVGVMFLVTATVLVTTKWAKGKRLYAESPWWQAFAIGVAQAMALIPGLSRSGLTIATAQLSGMKRGDALDFSFMMALPIILGAWLITMLDVLGGIIRLPPFGISATGFIASFIVSWLCMISLRRFIRNWSLAWFSLYLVPLGGWLLLG